MIWTRPGSANPQKCFPHWQARGSTGWTRLWLGQGHQGSRLAVCGHDELLVVAHGQYQTSPVVGEKFVGPEVSAMSAAMACGEPLPQRWLLHCEGVATMAYRNLGEVAREPQDFFIATCHARRGRFKTISVESTSENWQAMS